MASERPTADSLPREPMARLLAVMAWLRDRDSRFSQALSFPLRTNHI
jgi:hypothetical protein